ncbi:MAG: uracil-DNA glycosylase [Clostridiales bacterium]|jgi:DNA polymerase|nr:uracil-DNA glycosylase [Clostridiales bacterium]
MPENEKKRRALLAAYEGERMRLARLGAQTDKEGIFAAPVFGDGPLSPRLMLIGEAPGAEEVAARRAFVGKAGRQLDKLLAQSGICRADIYITNAVKYRPVTVSEKSMRNRTPSSKEARDALELLGTEIGILRPAIIATLGNVPLGALLALAGEKRRAIGELHGQAVKLNVAGHETVLFPLYHPASVIYNRALLPTCENDARRLGKLISIA